MAGAARLHEREKSSAGPHRTEQVGLEHPVPVLAGDALELPLQENSCGVDEDVDVTHGLDRIARERTNGGVALHDGRQRDRGLARTELQYLADRADHAWLVEIGDDHV